MQSFNITLFQIMIRKIYIDIYILVRATKRINHYTQTFPQLLGTQGHAAGTGNALAQGAGGHIHAGNGGHVGMALQIAVNMPQGGQILHREEAPVGEGGIQAGGGVALAEHEPVPVLPLARDFKLKIALSVKITEGNFGAVLIYRVY